LRGQPGSAEFMADYQAALAAFEAAAPSAPTDIGEGRTQPGSVAAAVACYFRSAAYADLAPTTKNDRHRVLERFREEHGHRCFAKFERKQVEQMLSQIEAPYARKNTLKALRSLTEVCRQACLIETGPTAGVRVKVKATAGYATWSEDDIARFEARHPIGTKERLAFALLLYTGQRRGDVSRMGRQHVRVRDSKLMVKQQKTGAELEIPLLPALQDVLAATPTSKMTFLTTSHGRPFAAHHFTRWFREACAQAHLPPGLTAHGLRKACCRRMAEDGCTAHEIAAITGHRTLAEVILRGGRSEEAGGGGDAEARPRTK
jgi:integrase